MLSSKINRHKASTSVGSWNSHRQETKDQHIRKNNTFYTSIRDHTTLVVVPLKSKTKKHPACSSQLFHQSGYAFMKPEPIHSGEREQYKEEESQRVMQARVAKLNEFNRRSFEGDSPTKKSLYSKNIRKCSSNLLKLEFESALKVNIAAKPLSHKDPAPLPPPLLSQLTNKLKPIQLLPLPRVLPTNLFSFYPRTVKLKKGKTSKKGRYQTAADDSLGVQPWETHKMRTEGRGGLVDRWQGNFGYY